MTVSRPKDEGVDDSRVSETTEGLHVVLASNPCFPTFVIGQTPFTRKFSTLNAVFHWNTDETSSVK